VWIHSLENLRLSEVKKKGNHPTPRGTEFGNREKKTCFKENQTQKTMLEASFFISSFPTNSNS